MKTRAEADYLPYWISISFRISEGYTNEHVGWCGKSAVFTLYRGDNGNDAGLNVFRQLQTSFSAQKEEIDVNNIGKGKVTRITGYGGGVEVEGKKRCGKNIEDKKVCK